MLFASRKLAFALLLAALALGASGCNSNAKKIVGKWKLTKVGDKQAKEGEGAIPYFEFKSDGSGAFTIEFTDPKAKEFFGGKDLTFPFKYKVNGDRIDLSEVSKEGMKEGPFGKSDAPKGTIKFENKDTLVITPDDEKDKPVTMTRMK
jgi:hypothetical protein